MCGRFTLKTPVPVLARIFGAPRLAGLGRHGSGRKVPNEMWAKYLAAPGTPSTDGWKKPHDDSYLKNAIEKAMKTTNKPTE